MDPFSLLYDVAKTMPGVRTIVRLVEILKDILCELKDATRTLQAAEGKVDSDTSVFRNICAALVAIGGAITATVAAIADPEPISRIAATVAAAASIRLAIIAIIAVIQAIDRNDKVKDKLGDEKRALEKNKNALEDLKRKLKDLIDRLKDLI